MKWKEALKVYYQKNKPDCYLPKKGTQHYRDVMAMVSEPTKKTPAKRAPAKKAPVKKPAKKAPAKRAPAKKTPTKKPAKKNKKCKLPNNLCKFIKSAVKQCE